jgi:hypothetical protein
VTETYNTQATVQNNKQKGPAHSNLVINSNIRAQIINRATKEREAKLATNLKQVQEAPGGTAEESSSQLLHSMARNKLASASPASLNRNAM